MEELLKNYIKHTQVNFSLELAEELNEILNRGLKMNTPIEDIEKSLQNRLIQYFQNLNTNEFDKTSRKLYEAYVDYDDENLIRSVRFLIRTYSKFVNLKLAKFFCNWRIKAMQTANAHNFKKLDGNKTENFVINGKSNNYNYDTNELIINVNEEMEKEIYFNRNKIDRLSRNKNEFVKTGNDNSVFNSNFQENSINENKLNHNDNYDPCKNNLQNNESLEKNTKRSIEEKYNILNLKGENNNTHIIHDNDEKQSRTQKNKNYIEKEEKKIWINQEINQRGNKISINNFGDLINKSFSSKVCNSPSNRKRSIYNYNKSKEKNDKTRLINNKEKQSKQNKVEKQKKEKNSDTLNIFDKLFLESYKKSDEKLLNEEIKKLSELDECTFQPNLNKRGIF